MEYPFMRERRHFIHTHKEFEPINEQVFPAHLLDEFCRLDADRASAANGQYPVVYDCVEASPYYEDNVNDPFIDERDAIELPPVTEQTEGLVNEPYQKKYFFNPYNPPY